MKFLIQFLTIWALNHIVGNFFADLLFEKGTVSYSLGLFAFCLGTSFLFYALLKYAFGGKVINVTITGKESAEEFEKKRALLFKKGE